MSETIAGTPPQDRGPMRPSTTSLEIVARSLGMLRQSLTERLGIWLVAAIFFTGTNIVAIIFGTPAHSFQSPLVITSIIVRIVAYAIVSAAAIRSFTGRVSVWSIDLPLLRYITAIIALLLALLIPILFLMALAMFGTKTANAVSMSVFVAGILVLGIVMLRASPWIAALAVGDNAINFQTAWKGMRGATLAAIGAVIWFSPVPLAHFVFSAQAQYFGSNALGLTLTVIDGLLSVLQVMLAMAVASMLYRYVKAYGTKSEVDYFPA